MMIRQNFMAGKPVIGERVNKRWLDKITFGYSCKMAFAFNTEHFARQ